MKEQKKWLCTDIKLPALWVCWLCPSSNASGWFGCSTCLPVSLPEITFTLLKSFHCCWFVCCRAAPSFPPLFYSSGGTNEPDIVGLAGPCCNVDCWFTRNVCIFCVVWQLGARRKWSQVEELQLPPFDLQTVTLKLSSDKELTVHRRATLLA